MRLYRDNDRTGISEDCVVTIGNFDSLHRGHQALIERSLELAKPGQDVAVVTFEPLPAALFAPAAAPARVVSVRQKLELFEQLGVDLVWMMRFNLALAGMSARAFVEHVLVAGLRACNVVVGEDFRYGKARSGDLDLLRQLAGPGGYGVHAIAPVLDGGERISSTRIRGCLAEGRLKSAGRLLGRPFTMQGRVFRGTQLGRTLGYPTANMRLAAAPSPLAGVFAVRVRNRSSGGPWMDGVSSLGRRPVVGGREFLVEAHIFDFQGDLYGQRLEVQFVEKLRDEANFPSLEALVSQMRKDEANARAVLRTN
jgi:riboflavin kinase/FMN adenylyltransferase